MMKETDVDIIKLYQENGITREQMQVILPKMSEGQAWSLMRGMYEDWIKKNDDYFLSMYELNSKKVYHVRGTYRGSLKYANILQTKVVLAVKEMIVKRMNHYFITLTWRYTIKQDKFGRDYIPYDELISVPHLFEKEFDKFIKKLRRPSGGLDYVRVAEVTDKGAYHLHIILATDKRLDKEFIQSKWKFISDVKEIKDNKYNRIVYYITKYLSKEHIGSLNIALLWYLRKKQVTISRDIGKKAEEQLDEMYKERREAQYRPYFRELPEKKETIRKKIRRIGRKIKRVIKREPEMYRISREIMLGDEIFEVYGGIYMKGNFVPLGVSNKSMNRYVYQWAKEHPGEGMTLEDMYVAIIKGLNVPQVIKDSPYEIMMEYIRRRLPEHINPDDDVQLLRYLMSGKNVFR